MRLRLKKGQSDILKELGKELDIPSSEILELYIELGMLYGMMYQTNPVIKKALKGAGFLENDIFKNIDRITFLQHECWLAGADTTNTEPKEKP